ncbi:MAG: hypothetical protein IIZ28_07755 [Erysipelotrichaceae bacterium]|nr:hypothetical protein [Erysipelotrichaceae bacterium]
MKETLVRNLYLVIIAWCLYLNGYILAAHAAALIGGVAVLVKNPEADLKLSGVISLSMYAVILSLYHSGNIPYFFPSLHIFMAAVMFNVFACIGYFDSMRRKDLLPILAVSFAAALLIGILIALSPAEEYTIFSKTSLYVFASFIFFPYLIPMICFYVSRTLKVIERRSIQKQGA